MQLPHQLPVDSAALVPVKFKIGRQATRVLQPGTGGEAALLVNRGAYTVYVGDSTVTGNSDGMPVPPLGTLALSTSAERYAIADPAAGTNTVDLWLLPAGIGYTPSPAEIAAQIAALTLTVTGTVAVGPGSEVTIAPGATVNVSGSQIVQQGGATAGTFVIPDVTTTWNAGATSGSIVAGTPGKHIVLLEMTVVASSGGAGSTVIQDSGGGAVFNLSLTPTATPFVVPCNNIALPLGASLVWSGGAGFGQNFGGLVSYKVI